MLYLDIILSGIVLSICAYIIYMTIVIFTNGSQPYVTFGCFPKNKKATKLRKGAVSPSFLINEI